MPLPAIAARFAVAGLLATAFTGLGAGLASAASTCYATSLQPGQSGTCVKYVQQMLNGTYAEIKTVNNGGRSYGGGALLTVDGQYGAATEAQVKTFQSYAAVSATGKVVPGSGIWDQLCAYAVNGESASQRSGSSAMDSVMRAGVSAGIAAKCPGNESVSKFVSLGGSIAAGLGLSPALNSLQNGQSATAGSLSECGRTEASFAYLLSKAKGIQLIQMACSGATSSNVRNTSQGTIQGPQLTLTQQDIKGNAVSLAFTGANDIGWIGDETTCLTTGCSAIPGAYSNGQPVIPTAKLTQLTANIDAILTTLHSEGARAIVVDQYYAVTQGSPTCIRKTFSSSDYNWMTTELNHLNSAIEAGVTKANAAHAGAKLVSPDFNGHGVCDADPYVAFPGHGKGAAEHPTANGQVYLAKINEAALNSLL